MVQINVRLLEFEKKLTKPRPCHFADKAPEGNGSLVKAAQRSSN